MRLIAVIFLLASCSAVPETPGDVVSGFENKYQNASSVSYLADYHIKYLSDDDTLYFPVEVNMVRNVKDSIFGGMVQYELLKEGEVFSNLYDLDTIYSYVPDKGSLTTYRPHLGEDWAIRGNAAGSAIETFFLNPEKLGKIILDTLADVKMTREKNGGYHLLVHEPDEDPFYDQERNFWFDEDFTLTRFTYRVGFQGNYQYSEWKLSDIVFNTLSPGDITAKRDNWKEGARLIKAYVPENFNIPLLGKGTVAPAFAGTLYQQNRPWSLGDAKGSPLVMDFWYMSCMPCIEAIPHLNEIYGEFSGDIAVIGVNSIDNNEKARGRFPKFIDQNELSYPILLTERSTDSLYHVRAYPSLYVLDKEGRIVFNQIGYNKQLADTLRIVLKQLL